MKFNDIPSILNSLHVINFKQSLQSEYFLEPSKLYLPFWNGKQDAKLI